MESPAGPLLLIVDDEAEIRGLLSEYFGRHGFRTRVAGSAADARATLDESPPDLAILDIHMRGEDGLSLARWLRAQRPRMGILMLTSAAETVDRVVGLEVGADDYMSKPFELRELLARVRGLLRRLAAPPPTPAGPQPTAASAGSVVPFGPCTLDLNRRMLFGPGGDEIAVTPAEFDLLALFARSPNRPLNRDQILEQAHHRGGDVFDRSIDLRIMRLRRKIERNPDAPEVIKTVRNVGYVFVAP